MPPLGGTLIQFQYHRQHGDAGEASASLVGPCTHGGKSRFDWIGRPNMPPMLGRNIVKCEQYLSVLGQALRCLGILAFISSDEEVKRYLRTLAVWRHPDGLEALFGLRLEVFGQLVQHIGRLMHPPPLPAGLSIHLAECLPKTPCPIPNGQGGAVYKPAALEVEE